MTELSSVLIGVDRWLSRIAANVLPTKDKSRSGLNSTPQRVEGLVGVESKAQSGLQYCPLCEIERDWQQLDSVDRHLELPQSMLSVLNKQISERKVVFYTSLPL